MLVVGLTGGIGSGKSTVLEQFALRQVPTIDADQISHALTQPQGRCLGDIRQTFGDKIFTDTGALDRDLLRQLVFDHPQARRQLEAIIHPAVSAEIDHQLAQLDAPYVLLCIPLLLETGYAQRVDQILVVDIPESLQLQRVQQRDGLSPLQAQQIIDAQIPRLQRLEAADHIIDNQGTLADLAPQIDRLHALFNQLGSDLNEPSLPTAEN